MIRPKLVITEVSDKLVAMVALVALDSLCNACLSTDELKIEDKYNEAKSLLLSERAQLLLKEFRAL